MLTFCGNHSTNSSEELWCSKTWKNNDSDSGLDQSSQENPCLIQEN